MLLALVIVAPSLAFALPLALRSAQGPEPPELLVARWADVFVPLVAVAAVAALLLARTSVRLQREEGTFF
ncbi:MAG TPA: hypothetical protein VFC31_06415 [Candidatus Limnocylindria bacterium]|nr:hypothetical protein [Candidatus Limnocylindria bacterium]